MQCPDKRILFSSAWGSFYYRLSKARFDTSGLWADLSPIQWLLRKFKHGFYMPEATWLVSRELTETAGPWDTRLSFDDDGEYFCRVIAASQGIQFIPEAKMFYRRTGCSSMSHIGRSDRKLESLLLSMQLHVSHIRALEDSARVRAACLKYLQLWSICFYPKRPDLRERVQCRSPRLWEASWKLRSCGAESGRGFNNSSVCDWPDRDKASCRCSRNP